MYHTKLNQTQDLNKNYTSGIIYALQQRK